MRAQSDSTAEFASGAGQEWLGNSVYQVPELEISKLKSWACLTAMHYRRGGGEAMWRGDRHRLVLYPDHLLAPLLLQVGQGHTRQMPSAEPGTLAFYSAGVEIR